MEEFPLFFTALVSQDEDVEAFDFEGGICSKIYAVSRDKRVLPTAGQNTLRIMVSGFVSYDGEGAIAAAPMGSDGTTTGCVHSYFPEEFALPFMSARPHLVWQQDGARSHGTEECRRVLDRMTHLRLGGYGTRWPARSPDFSPIEIVWRIIRKLLVPALPMLERNGPSVKDAFKAAWVSVLANKAAIRHAYDECWENMAYARIHDGRQRVFKSTQGMNSSPSEPTSSDSSEATAAAAASPP